jgi:hypothetical protein
MIVWDQDDYGIDPPHDWINRYPNSQVLPPIVCKTRALTGDVNANVGVIIVHPQSAAAAVDEVWVSKVQTHAPSDSTVAR